MIMLPLWIQSQYLNCIFLTSLIKLSLPLKFEEWSQHGSKGDSYSAFQDNQISLRLMQALIVFFPNEYDFSSGFKALVLFATVLPIYKGEESRRQNDDFDTVIKIFGESILRYSSLF